MENYRYINEWFLLFNNLFYNNFCFIVGDLNLIFFFEEIVIVFYYNVLNNILFL